MEKNQLIATDKFCTVYNVTYSFVESLQEIGLIEIVQLHNVQYLQVTHLQDIERMVRLHDELAINPEGIEAVNLLLKRIDLMQQEILFLKNKLRFYED